MTAANRLSELIKPDGSFLYQYQSALFPFADSRKYNVLRHAGSVWALYQASCVLLLSPHFEAARHRALLWLLKKPLAPSLQSGLCIVERGKAKLGANALVILALLSLQKEITSKNGAVAPEITELVEKLSDHLLAQVAHDDFIHKRDARSGAIEAFRSEYYTGEALFALLSVLRRGPGHVKLRIAQDIFNSLAARRYGVAEQSHWMMYAAEVAYEIAPHPNILLYADRLTKSILDNSDYRARQFCTPIACRSEALIAYLRLLRNANLNGSRFSPQVRTTIRLNLSLQLRNRLADGAFCRGAGNTNVRIDYLQHNISAFLGWAQLNDGLP